ncbi:P27 family phage terminase small subunit (plasmid) [Pseudorhodobacter turbinis]|uniref:P27 family phage terminase small subunit n=1 Tax=Pseudorhodobacter turbinis TaxID=2500533 RepID=A0A4P8EJU5_9RHOB|nr:P27 family phage terminase small subunit [Pseudorhodobacter turbinis]QCO57461.1 P27 family phage terminase small subunit [Pseudorhodobacter turbinis]
MAGKKGRSGGSNRKSIAEHELDGTYIAARHDKVLVPEKDRAKVKPQNHLLQPNPNVNREEVFDWFAEILNEQGMTHEVDTILLSQLVELYSIYTDALAYYKSDPEAVIGRKPAYSIALETGREIRIIMAEFRLTPISRLIDATSLNEKVEHDPIGDFMNARSVN